METGNNERKHQDKINKEQQKKFINYKEKINTTTKENDVKKVQVQEQKKCQTKIKRKTPEQRSSN